MPDGVFAGAVKQQGRGAIQQGARCADLLIPHAAAAEACAGEAAGVDDPSLESIGVLQQRNVDCRALTNRPYDAREWG
jgi:hypothetical protein